MIEQAWLKGFVDEAANRLKKKALAVDVGANVGAWTEDLAARFDSVIAVEPDDRASALIPELPNVDLHTVAAGETNGTVTLFMRPQATQNSTLEVHPINGDPVVEKKTVESVTLDRLCPEGADFVKIDVEGAEASVLRGCSADGRWDRTFFIVECHDSFQEVEAELVRLKKKVEKIPHPSAGAHPGHCWAAARPHDPVEPVVRAGRR